jgi:hypothetical protein
MPSPNRNTIVRRIVLRGNLADRRVVVQMTPAMAAGVTPKLWEMADMVKVLEDRENSRETVPAE